MCHVKKVQATAESIGVQIPEDLITDCVRLCCRVCPLEDDPSVIGPDLLSKDRTKFEQTGERKYVSKVPTPEGEARMSAIILEVAEPLLKQYGKTAERAKTP